MADSTNVQLIQWDNTRARTVSDLLRHVDDVLASYVADYNAQGISALATTAGANNIADGYTTDGRQPITGNQILNLKACIDQIRTAMDITNVSGVGSPPITTVNQIQVNGALKQ